MKAPSRGLETAAAVSRRRFLGSTLAAAAVTLVGAASSTFIAPEPAFAQSKLTPDEAIKALMDGSARYVENRFKSFDQRQTDPARP